MFSGFQSAYHLGHSTETALLKVVNNLLSALDEGTFSVLVLLDLSAAFDTVDHDILLHRLHHVFGIQDKALSWFKSYLTNKFQMVVNENLGLASKVVIALTKTIEMKGYEIYTLTISIQALTWLIPVQTENILVWNNKNKS